jgi:tetratricopeptide (TPR) repeat protein
VARADGVPFVLEEMIRSMGENGPADVQSLPHSVESVIHARLQRLSPRAKALAQALSLLGEDVDVEFVGAMLDVDARQVADDLAELERFAFVHPLRGATTHMRHQIIAEACSNTIPRERRRQLHRIAARTITARYANLRGRYEQLAFHAESAGDDAEALQYLWEAGLEARRNSAAASLSLIFDRALEVVARMGEAAESRYVDFVLMGFALMVQRGEFEKMNIHLPRVMDLVRRSGQPRLVCNTLSQLGMICWYDGRYREGLKATEEGLAMAQALESPALIFSNQIMRTNLLHDTGQLERALSEQRWLCEMLTGELESVRLGAPGLPRSIALSFMGWFMIDTGQHEEGVEFGRQVLEVAERERDAYSEMLARHTLARHLLMLGRNAEAVDSLSAARELSERGYDSIKSHIAGHLAQALSRVGEAHRAIELVEDVIRRGLHLRTGQMQVFSLHAGHGEALARGGDLQRGLAQITEAIAIARRVNNPCLLAEALGLRARLLEEFADDDPRIENDLAEQRTVCERYGAFGWLTSAN